MKKVILFLSIICFMGFNDTVSAQEFAGIDQGIRDSVNYFSEIIEPGAKIVILNIQSENANLSEYLIDELIKYFIEKRNYTIVDRQNLELIQQEMDFQLSGEVSDESALSIGKKLGAEIIISGSINQFGSNYRLRLRAIDVETAAIHGIQTKTILMDNTLSALLGHAVDTADTRNTRSNAGGSTGSQKRFTVSIGVNARVGGKFRNEEVEFYPTLASNEFDIGGGIFIDLTYVEIRIDMIYGTKDGEYYMDDMPPYIIPYGDLYSYYIQKNEYFSHKWALTTFGLFVKYPIHLSKITFFPLLGAEYELDWSHEGDKIWGRLGAGLDVPITNSIYFRGEILYGLTFYSEGSSSSYSAGSSSPGGGYSSSISQAEHSFFSHGPVINIGMGFRLESVYKVRKNER